MATDEMHETSPAQQKPVTMRDIAERCHVTTATVSLALRRHPRLSAATIERVLNVAAELGYDASHNQAARRMVMRRYGRDVINRVVAIFLPSYFYKATYFSYLIEGLLDVLTEHGFTPVLGTSFSEKTGSHELPPIFANGEVDGALILPGGGIDSKCLRRIPSFSNRPILSLVNGTPETQSVVADDETGGHLAASHLLDLGHRHIMEFYSPQDSPTLQARYHGVCRAYTDRGLSPAIYLHPGQWYLGDIGPRHHLLLPGQAEFESSGFPKAAQEDFLRYLETHAEITAILAANDTVARRIWYLFKQAGKHIPEDISLIGYDDCGTIPDENGRNVLTTVNVPLVEIGRQAAEMVIKSILHPTNTTDATKLTLPVTLTARATTGPAPR